MSVVTAMFPDKFSDHLFMYGAYMACELLGVRRAVWSSGV